MTEEEKQVIGLTYEQCDILWDKIQSLHVKMGGLFNDMIKRNVMCLKHKSWDCPNIGCDNKKNYKSLIRWTQLSKMDEIHKDFKDLKKLVLKPNEELEE